MQEGAAFDPANIADHVHISPIYEREVPSMNTVGSGFRVLFHNMDAVADAEDFALTAIQYVIDHAFDNAQPNDLVGLEIRFVFYCYLVCMYMILKHNIFQAPSIDTIHSGAFPAV